MVLLLRRSKRKLVGAVVGCIRDGCHRRRPAVGHWSEATSPEKDSRKQSVLG